MMISLSEKIRDWYWLAQEYYKPRRWQRADCQGRSFVWGECSAVGYKSIAGHVVPDWMGERDGSAIIYGSSIDAATLELYKKYGLTDEEIQFIESMIRPME